MPSEPIRPAREVADDIASECVEHVETSSFGTTGGPMLTDDRLRLVEWLRERARDMRVEAQRVAEAGYKYKSECVKREVEAQWIDDAADDLESAIRSAGGDDDGNG